MVKTMAKKTATATATAKATASKFSLIYAFMALSIITLGMVTLASPVWAQATTEDISTMPKGAYSLDTSHASVVFKVSHMGFADYIGRFNSFEGDLDFKPDALRESVVRIQIDPASIDTNHKKLEKKLRAEDALNVEAYPNMTFKSREIAFTDNGKAKITGDLKMRGESHPVTLDVAFNGGGVHPFSQRHTLGFEATTTIDRTKWGFDTWTPMVGKEVDIIISAEFNSLAKAE